MSEDYILFPFLVLIDTSSSMEGDPIQAVNAALPELLSLVRSDPQTEEIARVGIIEFNSAPRLRLPLTDLQTVSQMPVLTAGGSTSYSSAFSLARETLETQLRGLGKKFYRPIVFFLSDGQPTDPESSWQVTWRRLTDSSWKYRPTVVAFRFGDADAKIIQQVGTKFAFMARDSNPVEAVREIFRQLLGSIISTSQTGQTSTPGLMLSPDINQHFESLPVLEP